MVNNNIYIINGPNLNMLGRRSPAVYGTETMEQILIAIQREKPELQLRYFQSNHEGCLIDTLQQCAAEGVRGIVLNAGGYTHTSVALRDAVEIVREAGIPVVEVHISDITQREPFRRTSLLTDICSHSIIGIGTRCYSDAITWIENHSY